MDAGSRGIGARLAGFSDVETLFADLFRFQVGAPETLRCKIQPVPDAGTKRGRTYNISIVHEETTRSRRMTIAPIGENTGSKSQCFSVIYDHPIVVKVPPTPITRLSDYYEDLRSEFTVRKKLLPRECVIPNLSVICKKLHKFPDADTADEDVLEQRYMQWLENHPEHQGFLQIGGGFAFFMDLTRFFFLSQVMEMFHDTGKALHRELMAAAETIESLDRFEDRYGSAGAELFADLQEAWQAFRHAVEESVSSETEALQEGSMQRMREGFILTMAGKPHKWEMPPALKTAGSPLSSRLNSVASAHANTARSFFSLVEGAVSDRMFHRHSTLMGEMGTNLLDLLAWLYEKRVAIRDLKPDNLLVAGDRSAYPQFLASASEYAIGLIDLETAVDFGNPEASGISQPQLGGTPLYGTPSHLFPNQMLRRAHEDLPPILHMQDWYAVVAILFEIITGETLFQKPAQQFPPMLRRLGEAMAGEEDLLSVYQEAAAVFWPAARQALHENLKRHRVRLGRVSVHVPKSIRSRLHEHVDALNQECLQKVDRHLESHELFRRGANRQRLQQCTASEVEQLRDKYTKSPRRNELVPLLEGLIAVKREVERSTDLKKRMNPASGRVRAGDLLLGMFEVIYEVMQPTRHPAAARSDQQPPLPEILESAEGLRYTVTVAPMLSAGKRRGA